MKVETLKEIAERLSNKHGQAHAGFIRPQSMVIDHIETIAFRDENIPAEQGMLAGIITFVDGDEKLRSVLIPYADAILLIPKQQTAA